MSDNVWGLKRDEISSASEALLKQLSALGELVTLGEMLSDNQSMVTIRTTPRFAGIGIASSTPFTTAAARAALKVELGSTIDLALDRAIELGDQLDYLIESLKKASNE